MDFKKLPAFNRDSGAVHVIIDRPKGNRNKFSWSEKWKLFEMIGGLSAGVIFPFDFGFIPQTRGGDGDPLDVRNRALLRLLEFGQRKELHPARPIWPGAGRALVKRSMRGRRSRK